MPNANFTRLEEHAKEAIQSHPDLKEEILEFVQLCKDECEDPCASVTHEIELAIESINDLIDN